MLGKVAADADVWTKPSFLGGAQSPLGNAHAPAFIL
jgi:hypothetical protein